MELVQTAFSLNVETRDGCRNISIASTDAIEMRRNILRQKNFFDAMTQSFDSDAKFQYVTQSDAKFEWL